ncbi:hypothetical protein YC2023_088877 [Brassica napus]
MDARERLKESEIAVRRDDVVVFLDRNLEMDKLFIIFSESSSLLIRLTSHRKSFGFVPRRTNITKLLKTKEMTNCANVIFVNGYKPTTWETQKENMTVLIDPLARLQKRSPSYKFGVLPQTISYNRPFL